MTTRTIKGSSINSINIFERIDDRILSQSPTGYQQFFQTSSLQRYSENKSKLDNNLNSGKIIQKIKEIPKRENIWNVPNVFTLSRLAASPIIGYFILNQQYELALGLFFYAGISDLLDGFIARKYNMKTMVGTVMDPLADKTLMTVLTVTLAMKNLLPAPIAIIILGRDVGLIIASFYYRYISLPHPKTLTRFFDMSIPSAEVNTTLQLVLMGTTISGPIFGWVDSQALVTLQ
ncbi:5749_t:CDS:2 [Entrophospora sp. SA101]|nr:5749_t:CDS:2 [Entrophospora sp. SA101]CAJ0843358.1 3055_t:CDS:2 [Entrophospora sp. SA101]